MPCSLQCRVLYATSLAFLAVTTTVATADTIRMHSKGEALPFDHQGPFVTTSDGGLLGVGRSNAFISRDDGRSWNSFPLFQANDKYEARDERALLKLRDGTVVFAWMNERQRHQGGPWGKGGEAEAAKWVLPVYVSRSTDDGETWSEPLMIQEGWCGAIRSLIQLKSGRLVLVAQKVIPWRHVTLTYVSDDQGKTWNSSNLVDIETTDSGDHGGTMEGSVIELTDGRLYMLIRTTRGWLWEAYSSDGGQKWEGVAQSKIRSSTCCGQLARLASGRLALLWNHPTDENPRDIRSREELSLAFSDDDSKTWTKRLILSKRSLKPGEPYYMARQSYPYLYERSPGTFWITTMQGGLRMKIAEADLLAQVDSHASEPDLTVVAFGTSTTARRSGVENVYADLLRKELPKQGLPARVVNQGVPGNRTTDAIARFESDVRAWKPDVVIVLFGLNDSAVDVWRNATEPRVPIESYRKNLTTMVRTLKGDGAKPILVTPQPMHWTEKLKELYAGPPYHDNSPYSATDPLGFNATLADYVRVVREVAELEEVALVDLH
ncbi:MAG: exo-alpha-sialidase, partial [Pirellulaceae bacterium]|nr:exo-alpha-sialidase [Pirellulaceae bacterium]